MVNGLLTGRELRPLRSFYRGMALADVLKRIDRRVAAMKLDRAKASRKANLSDDAIRNIERAVEDESRRGPTLHTITALAEALETTVAWLVDGTGPETKPRNYLRTWREFRGLSIDELAAAVGTEPSVIQTIEEQAEPLGGKWLSRLAPALQTSAGFLRDHDPNRLDSSFVRAVADIPEKNHEQALRMLKALGDAG